MSNNHRNPKDPNERPFATGFIPFGNNSSPSRRSENSTHMAQTNQNTPQTTTRTINHFPTPESATTTRRNPEAGVSIPIINMSFCENNSGSESGSGSGSVCISSGGETTTIQTESSGGDVFSMASRNYSIDAMQEAHTPDAQMSRYNRTCGGRGTSTRTGQNHANNHLPKPNKSRIETNVIEPCFAQRNDQRQQMPAYNKHRNADGTNEHHNASGTSQSKPLDTDEENTQTYEGKRQQAKKVKMYNYAPYESVFVTDDEWKTPRRQRSKSRRMVAQQQLVETSDSSIGGSASSARYKQQMVAVPCTSTSNRWISLADGQMVPYQSGSPVSTSNRWISLAESESSMCGNTSESSSQVGQIMQTQHQPKHQSKRSRSKRVPDIFVNVQPPVNKVYCTLNMTNPKKLSRTKRFCRMLKKMVRCQCCCGGSKEKEEQEEQEEQEQDQTNMNESKSGGFASKRAHMPRRKPGAGAFSVSTKNWETEV